MSTSTYVDKRGWAPRIAAPVLRLVAALLLLTVAHVGMESAFTSEPAVALAQGQPSDSTRSVPAGTATVAPNTAVKSSPASRGDMLDHLQPADIDITLTPSRQNLVAGDLWAVYADIRNRSVDKPLWIDDNKSNLSFAPEVYGAAQNSGSLNATFPTIDYTNRCPYNNQHCNDVAIRIDPQTSYTFYWKLGGQPTSADPTAWVQLLTLPGNAILNYAFFYPGTFRGTAVVHIWYEQPAMTTTVPSEVQSMDSSFAVVSTRDIVIDASPWVLMFGAAVGGLLCRVVQRLTGVLRAQELDGLAMSLGRRLSWDVTGIVASILLPAIGTVLLSRLATSEFPISVRVRDIWGAIAMGFVIQWLGAEWLRKIMPRATPDEATEHAPGKVALDVRPPVLRLEDVKSGAATVSVSAYGFGPHAKHVESVQIVPLNGSDAMLLSAMDGAAEISGGRLQATGYGVPTTLAPGAYRVKLKANDGQTAVSGKLVSIADSSANSAAAVAAV
jgi:hypothetical protein